MRGTPVIAGFRALLTLVAVPVVLLSLMFEHPAYRMLLVLLTAVMMLLAMF